MQSLTHVRNFEALLERYPQARPLWVVDIGRQRILRLDDGGNQDAAPVSTSRHGTGSEPGSFCTPLGLHRVSEIIGRKDPPGQRFISREPVGSPLPSEAWSQGEDDGILSRILWLDGQEPSLNTTSHDRYIYIHGTNHEHLLGTPASQGCIRMANQTLINWTRDLGNTLPWVWIGTIGQELGSAGCQPAPPAKAKQTLKDQTRHRQRF